MSSESPGSADAPHPPDAGLTDGELLQRITRGDLGLFDDFVDRYRARLLAYIRQRLPDAHRAEDIVQEVFLRVFRARHAHGYDGRSTASVTTWLFTIAGNCVTDELRARGRQRLTLLPDPPEPPHATDTPLTHAVERETHRQLGALLGQLPPEQAEVVALKVWGELTLAQIAEVTGVPLSTVKSRLAYGLRKIAHHLSTRERSQA